jgi:LmbE family N-acetylglucosaminyl deacetylase
LAGVASHERFQEEPVLLLAPHFDDAALSCAALLDRTSPLDVATVFAGAPSPPVSAPWDRHCGFADSDESVASRRAEEERALGAIGHRLTFLPLLEEQYAERRTGGEQEAIRDHVRTWAGDHGGGLVAIPAGAGWGASRLVRRFARMLGRERIPPRHPDHLLVRDAVLEAWSAEERWTPLLYEEFPYLAGGAAPEPAGALELELPVDRDRKAERIRSYRSQLPHISPPGVPVDDPGALPPVERYWLLKG